MTILPLAVDHIGGARRQPRMLRPGDVIGLLGRRSRGRDREGAAAMLDREFLQDRQVVGRHADHLGARLFEVADRVAEGMRFGGAALVNALGKK